MEIAKPNVNNALEHALSLLPIAAISSTRRYGWGQKSAGAEVSLADSAKAWLRVQYVEKGKVNTRQWDGEVSAGELTGIAKPALLRYVDWEDDAFLWRATLTTFIPYATCSDTPELRTPLEIDNSWFVELKHSLLSLEQVRTDRTCVRQDLVTRRIGEQFGAHIDTTICNWVCSHGDLHWANTTFPKLTILDWEGWGMAPKGTDPAFLLSFSVLVPEIANKVRAAFSEILGTRDGKLSILFACSELIRMTELYNDHPGLRNPLELLANETLAAL